MNWARAIIVAVAAHAAIAGGAVLVSGQSRTNPVKIELASGGAHAVEIVNVVNLSAGKAIEPAKETLPEAVVPSPPKRPSQPVKPPPSKHKPEPKSVALPPETISLAPKPDLSPSPTETRQTPPPVIQPQALPLPPSMEQPQASPISSEPSNAMAETSSMPGQSSQTARNNRTDGPKGKGKPLSKKELRAQHRYLGEVMAWLVEHRVYPAELKKKKIEGTVKVRFTFMKSGEVTAVSVAESSGSEALDAAATGILRRANPLPPIPKSLKREQLTITLPIEYSLITD